MSRFSTACAAFALLCIASIHAADESKQEIKTIFDFEEQRDISSCEIMEFKDYHTLSDEHATHGKKSMRFECGEHGYVQVWSALPWSVRDWSPYDTFMMDVFVEGTEGIKMSILVGDEDWIKVRTVHNRHDANYSCHPGANTITMPVSGMYRGSANGRYADMKTNIDTKNIVRWDFGFEGPKGKNTVVYVDYIRLVREVRPPAGVWAFGFGPEDGTVYPGFQRVTWNSVYGQKDCKAGLKNALSTARFARDDTYPSRLYQECVEIGDNSFITDLPNGKYHVWMINQDACYWDWEQSKFSKRWIEAGGKPVWSEERADGICDKYWRFEDIEPHPGDDIWETFLGKIWRPQRFDVEVTDGKLKLDFKSDPVNNRRAFNLSGLIIYPDNLKAQAEPWVSEVEARNKEEAIQRTTFLGPQPKELQIPPDAAAKGYWLGYPALEEDVSFADAPGKPEGKFTRFGTRDQLLHFTFAVRPLKDIPGEVKLTSTDLTGPGGAIPAAEVDLRYVQHALQRNNAEFCYWIAPETLRHLPGSKLALSKELTRQFWITVHVPADAKPGVYSGEVTLNAGALTEKFPLSIEVLDVTLDESDFIYGFFGVWVPEEYPAAQQKALRKEVFTLLKRAGFNSYTGGPDIPFSGFDTDGKPKLDFAACDEWIKTARECGFTKPIQSYCGPCAVHIDPNSCQEQFGKPFPDTLKLVWTAIKEHGEKEGWPRIDYSFVDEPRVLEPAQKLLAMLKTYREAVPWVRIGGYYTVDWNHNQPLPVAIQDIFKTLVWSSLNGHTQTDLDKTKKFGRELFIYNQGITRYSFGAYQWSEMMKGVKGRMQWMFNANYGFQFFNLDGRESDVAMLNFGRKELIPSIHFARCTEGAADFRYAVTLWNMAEKKKDSPEAQAAKAFLETVSNKIAVNQNGAPGGTDPYGLGATSSAAAPTNDEAFRNACVEHIKKLMK